MDIRTIKSKINFENQGLIGVIIALAIFIIIIGVYYYFIYSGLKSKASQKQAELSQITSKYNSYMALVRSYPATLKRYRKLKLEFAGYLSELPSKKNIPQLLMKISNYEKALELNLKMFKPGKGAAKGFYETVPFSMSISGDFYNVYKFFYKLADMRRIVDIHNVSITRASKGSKVSVSFNGITFSFIGAPPVANNGKKPGIAQKNGGTVKR